MVNRTVQGEGGWRDAVVVRARTAAQDVRLIEFAVAGPAVRFTPGLHVILKLVIDGVSTLQSCACLPAEPGTVRVIVSTRAGMSGGSRHAWSLIEGARARLAISGNRSTRFALAPLRRQAAAGTGGPHFAVHPQAPRLTGVPVRLSWEPAARAAVPTKHRIRRFSHLPGGAIPADINYDR